MTVADLQPTGDEQCAADISLVTRLQLRVKELEWERSTLQSEIDSKQTVDTERSYADVEESRTEVFSAVKVRSACRCYV